MINENAKKILEKRYIAKDENGVPLENIDGMFHRVAHNIAKAESKDKDKWEQIFYDMMVNLEFLPNSPTLMNAGRPLGQLSGCFVLPIEDNTESIFDAIKYSALVHKSGGGTGFSFSRLRPNGSIVKSTAGVASGPVSFLKVFNAATECIKQGGTRRGANMGILRVDHPDIRTFINCKKDNKEVTNFNLSVGVTEEFMNAALHNETYALINPVNKKISGYENAAEIFQMIIDGSWENGEPGIIFLDRVNKDNPTPELGEIESTNPCGEQPLLPYESCNLGSINLSNFVTKDKQVDCKRLAITVQNAVRFLDNVVTVNKFPLQQVTEMTLKTRKIGLGVMGWADMLIQMNIPYNSDKAISLAEEIMEFINEYALCASLELAKEKGAYPQSKNHDDYEFSPRNAARTTIAPTGTLSIIADCSSGIEPLFAIVYERNQADMRMLDVNPEFIRILGEKYTVEPTKELLEKILKSGTIQGMDEIPKEVQDVFLTAHDIAPEWHIKMQAAFQRHVNNAVSKTINFKHDATKEDVKRAFIMAYTTGCKGVTTYRDGSRQEQVLSTGASYQKDAPRPLKDVVFDEGEMRQEQAEYLEEMARLSLQVKPRPRPRPDITTGFTEKVKIGCGNLYITVNYDEQGICEVFTNNGRAGGCPSQSEAVSRLVSLALRTGISTDAIIEQLKGIRCSSTIGKGLECLSCPDAIGRLIEKMEKEIADTYEFKPNDYHGYEKSEYGNDISYAKNITSTCPNCKKTLEHEGGCVICRNCGFSQCN